MVVYGALFKQRETKTVNQLSLYSILEIIFQAAYDQTKLMISDTEA